MHIYLISLNAFDLPLNVWPPECVFHDTDPLQLLRSNCCLPMGSLVGMSTEGVKLILHMNLWRPNNVSYTYIYIWPSVKTAFYDLISASIASISHIALSLLWFNTFVVPDIILPFEAWRPIKSMNTGRDQMKVIWSCICIHLSCTIYDEILSP